MKERIKRAARRKLIRRLRARHQQVKPIPAQAGLFNFRCHENSVEFLRLNPDRRLSIWETIYVDDGTDPCLHYLVKDDDTSEFLEVTLGWRTDDLEFYLVRQLLPADHKRIHSEFDRSLKDWTHEFVSPLWRFLFNIDRIL